MNNRKITSLLLPALIFCAFVVFHVSLNKNAVDLGLSWTLSAMLPYILTAIAAFLFAKQLGWVIGKLNPVRRKVIGIVSFLLLGGIAFGVHPIYEGDFSNTYDELIVDGSNKELVPSGFSMVALPGCPFCKMRIPTLNMLAEKNPSLSIQVVLIAAQEETQKMYEENLDPSINFVVSSNGQLLSQLTGGTFPVFLYKKEKTVLKWTNNGFGVAAMDWIADK